VPLPVMNGHFRGIWDRRRQHRHDHDNRSHRRHDPDPAAVPQADPPAPRSVKIEISPRCNYRCGFCALRTREKQPKWDMDFGLFKRITREMREAGVEEIGVFYLGESLHESAAAGRLYRLSEE
jgi:hypothetical protein